jgi:glutamine synthetase
VKEAKKRGIPNISNTVDALAAMATPEAAKLFEKYGVLSEKEVHSRYEIYLEKYAKDINIEAQASIAMVKNQYLPAVIGYTGELAQTVASLKSVSAPVSVQKELLTKISSTLDSAANKLADLETTLKKAQGIHEAKARAIAYRDKVVPAVNELRTDIDTLEQLLPSSAWPVPSYAEMLFKL